MRDVSEKSPANKLFAQHLEAVMRYYRYAH